jgi:serine/threonine protein kinase
MDSLKHFAGRFEKYDLVKELGRGRNGTVFLARHKEFGVEVAFKLLTSANSVIRERFIREARMLFTFNHPNLVSVRDFGRSEDLYYLTMNYEPGESLNNLFPKLGLISLEDACKISLQLLSALEYVHASGAIHRDIQPNTILIQDYRHDLRVFLVGFGDAKLLSDPLDAGELNQLTILNDVGGLKGTNLGSPQYMAPELAYQEADVQSDLFAVSIVLLELLVGGIDWSDSIADGMWAAKIPHHFLSILEDVRSDIPFELQEILARGLAVNPDRRIAASTDYISLLEEMLHKQNDGMRWSMFSRFLGRKKKKEDLTSTVAGNADETLERLNRLARRESNQRLKKEERLLAANEDKLKKLRANVAKRLDSERRTLQKSTNAEVSKFLQSEISRFKSEKMIITKRTDAEIIKFRKHEQLRLAKAEQDYLKSLWREQGLIVFFENIESKKVHLLRLMLEQLMHSGLRRVLLDFTVVTELNDDATALLVDFARRLGGESHCVLLNVKPNIRDAIELQGFDRFFRIRGESCDLASLKNIMRYEWPNNAAEAEARGHEPESKEGQSGLGESSGKQAAEQTKIVG